MTKSALREYSDALSDTSVAQFLATRHWTVQLDRQFDQTWVEPGKAGDSVSVLRLPRDRSMVDYSRRMAEVLETLCEAYDWTPSEVTEQVALVHADLFFVRVDQHMSDGTIPLRQASKLLDSIDQMIRASALAAHNPTSSGRGRVPDVVNGFLTDDVRMGHTKKGSFIITVAARLSDVDLAAASSRNAEVIPSFTRQVMTTLSRSLAATKSQVAANPSDRQTMSEAVEHGLRLPVLHALESIGEAEGLRSLDMSFEWAAAEPIQGEFVERVVLDRAELEKLPEVRDSLTLRHEPQMETLVGPVIELRRAESSSGDTDNTEIVVRADVDGRLVKVAIPLSGLDYEWAIRAHQAKLPFTVSGVLGKKRNSWRLTEQIEVDRSFLEHHFSTARAPQA